MRNIVIIICFLVAIILISIEYFKEKKKSRLLGIFMLFLSILFFTPLGNKIGKAGENIFVVILIILLIILFYLLLKEDKEK
jgi:4-hydroxybenzoate polyprenyltransferase